MRDRDFEDVGHIPPRETHTLLPPPQEGNHYRIHVNDTKGTSVYIPREQHTAFGEVLDIFVELLLKDEISYSEINISIW
jgi:hypothetical protein